MKNRSAVGSRRSAVRAGDHPAETGASYRRQATSRQRGSVCRNGRTAGSARNGARQVRVERQAQAVNERAVAVVGGRNRTGGSRTAGSKPQAGGNGRQNTGSKQ